MDHYDAVTKWIANATGLNTDTVTTRNDSVSTLVCAMPLTDVSKATISYAKTTVKKNAVPTIKKVVFNDPATIVIWSDESKTVVKRGERDTYDPEKGLAMCIAKKFLGNKGNYYETFKKWLPKDQGESAEDEYQSCYLCKHNRNFNSPECDDCHAVFKGEKLTFSKWKPRDSK